MIDNKNIDDQINLLDSFTEIAWGKKKDLSSLLLHSCWNDFIFISLLSLVAFILSLSSVLVVIIIIIITILSKLPLAFFFFFATQILSHSWVE